MKDLKINKKNFAHDIIHFSTTSKQLLVPPIMFYILYRYCTYMRAMQKYPGM